MGRLCDFLVGGFNPEKYSSKWESSPNRGEHRKYLLPPSSFGLVVAMPTKQYFTLASPSQILRLRWNFKKSGCFETHLRTLDFSLAISKPEDFQFWGAHPPSRTLTIVRGELYQPTNRDILSIKFSNYWHHGTKKTQNILVGGFNSSENMLVRLDHFPADWGEHSKKNWNHHVVLAYIPHTSWSLFGNTFTVGFLLGPGKLQA